MAIQAINSDAVRQFVSTRDPDYGRWRAGAANSATVFSLRTLSAGELYEILDATQEIVTGSGRPAVRVNLNRRNWRLVESALVGWHNLSDERGNPLAFEFSSASARRPHAAERCLDALASWVIRELAQEILRDSTLSEDDVKNSAASSEDRSPAPSEATPR